MASKKTAILVPGKVDPHDMKFKLSIWQFLFRPLKGMGLRSKFAKFNFESECNYPLLLSKASYSPKKGKYVKILNFPPWGSSFSHFPGIINGRLF